MRVEESHHRYTRFDYVCALTELPTAWQFFKGKQSYANITSNDSRTRNASYMQEIKKTVQVTQPANVEVRLKKLTIVSVCVGCISTSFKTFGNIKFQKFPEVLSIASRSHNQLLIKLTYNYYDSLYTFLALLCRKRFRSTCFYNLPYALGFIHMESGAVLGFQGFHRPCRHLNTSCPRTPPNQREICWRNLQEKSAGEICRYNFHGNLTCSSNHVVLLN
jgi:hypothetical protein